MSNVNLTRPRPGAMDRTLLIVLASFGVPVVLLSIVAVALLIRNALATPTPAPIARAAEPEHAAKADPEAKPQPKPVEVKPADVKPETKPQPAIKEPPPIVLVPKVFAPPKEVALPGPGNRPMISLIPLIDPTQDFLQGKWHIEDAALVCDAGSFVPRVQIPYLPPKEYDFLVTFHQPRLRNGISLVMPNPNGGSFFWYVGNYKGAGYGFFGNPKKEGRAAGLIRAGTTHTTKVEVRAGSVRGFVDDKEMMQFDTDFRDLTCDSWRQVKDTRLLAVACDDPTVFEQVRVVEVTGRGTKLR
jgi:hypothetical protein